MKSMISIKNVCGKIALVLKRQFAHQKQVSGDCGQAFGHGFLLADPEPVFQLTYPSTCSLIGVGVYQGGVLAIEKQPVKTSLCLEARKLRSPDLNRIPEGLVQSLRLLTDFLQSNHRQSEFETMDLQRLDEAIRKQNHCQLLGCTFELSSSANEANTDEFAKQYHPEQELRKSKQ